MRPDVPEYLREICHQSKVIELDIFSISNPSNREEGCAAHRAFLCSKSPLLLLDNVNLFDSGLVENRLKLHIYSWIVDEVDATPVTALVALNEDDINSIVEMYRYVLSSSQPFRPCQIHLHHNSFQFFINLPIKF